MLKTLRNVAYVWKHKKVQSPTVDRPSGPLLGSLPQARRWNILAVQMDVYGGRARA